MNRCIGFLITLILLMHLFSCTTKTDNQDQQNVNQLPIETNQVDVLVLNESLFMQDVLSNGKLSAIEKADLYFKSQGTIAAIDVKNGQTIEAGTPIAQLHNAEQQFNLEKANEKREQAIINKLDALISMGYTRNSQEFQPEHEKIANIRSGYKLVDIEYREAEYQYQQTIIKAPFSGIISGIIQHRHEKANVSNAFCTLLNTSRFHIRFPLLETEISKIKIGQKALISPISLELTTVGTISEISPQVDENGLVWLKAEVINPGDFLDGMNVKVSIKLPINHQLIVPKEAVVLRQNREVLFRYDKGIAYWTYIKILHENENHYAVSAIEGASLAAGDTVIVSNNLNLAHESEVEIEKLKNPTLPISRNMH
ncbi:MAG: efflux RND transporter periplasmic adaptor subunit [Carboxylicivirga sp.]|nr:efflux RND transporter periplasmic adaptor subunit [Carboxylicivirga sp.]